MADRNNLSNPRNPIIEFDEDDYADEVEEEEEEIEIDYEDDVSNESSQFVTMSTSSGGDKSVESMTKELKELKSPSHASVESFTSCNNNNNNTTSSNSKNSVEEELPSTSGVGAFNGRAVRIPLRSITGEVEEKEGEKNKSKSDLVPITDGKYQHGSDSDWKEKTQEWFKRNVSMSSSPSPSSSSLRPTFPLTSGTADPPKVESSLSLYCPDREAESPSSIQQQSPAGPSSNQSDAENLTPPHHHRPFYFPSDSSDMILNREENRHEGRLIGGHNTYQMIVKKKQFTSSVRVSDSFGSKYSYEKKTLYKSKVTKLAPFSRSSPTPPPQSPSSNSETLLFKEPTVPIRNTRKRRTITGESATTSTSRRAIQGSNNPTTSFENQNESTRRDGVTSNGLNTNSRGQRGARRSTMATSSDFQPCSSKRCKPSNITDPYELSSSSSSSSSDIPLGGTAQTLTLNPETRSVRELKPRLGRSMKQKGFMTSTPASRGFPRRQTPHKTSFRRKLQFDRASCEKKTDDEKSSIGPDSDSQGHNENDNNNNSRDDEESSIGPDSDSQGNNDNNNNSPDDESTGLSDSEPEKDN